MKRFISCCLLIAWFLPGRVVGSSVLAADTSNLPCFQNATRQLNEALAIMQKHYYKKGDVQWDSLMNSARARLNESKTCEDAFETVNWCFRQINELHSFLMPATAAAVYNNNVSLLKEKPRISQLVGEIKGEVYADKGIAYLTVPWIRTTDSAICTGIADSLQGLIAMLDQQGISKWIIDLRKNTGGNCWPMLAGIGPLLGNGICGYFVSPTEKIPISYENGVARQGRQARCSASKVYQTKVDKKWIVVLTGPQTSSSGEIVALSFKGMDQAFHYGQPTAGFTTANATYTLSDDALLVVTVCMEADRAGRIYEGKIIPDQIITPATGNDWEDPVKAAATMWLHVQ